MRNQRNFSLEFKRRVVEELLSGESRPAQLCRRYNITSSVLYHWKRQYSRGKFNNEPTEERALRDRIEKLERLVGQLTTNHRIFYFPSILCHFSCLISIALDTFEEAPGVIHTQAIQRRLGDTHLPKLRKDHLLHIEIPVGIAPFSFFFRLG